MAVHLNTDKFKLIGGAASLDFVNTVSGRVSNPNKKSGRDYLDLCRSDKLENYADLLAWSVKAEIIDRTEAKRLAGFAAKEPQATEKILRRGLILRETVYRLFKSAIEGWKPEAADLEILNRELAIANKHEKINYDRDGFGWQWDAQDDALDYMLWRVTQSAAKILTSKDLTRLRQCGGDDCGWLFFDASRNRSRNWCDMKDCGNLAKVRRFRQRQHQES